MHVTITGGFGFLGSILAENFLSKGYEVTIFSRNIPDYLRVWSRRFDVKLGDVTSNNVDISGDLVVHCAALNETSKLGMEEFIKTNVQGTRNVLDLCVRNQTKHFIKISTFHAYGMLNVTITEKTAEEPKSNYGISQNAGDKVCLDYSDKIKPTVIRFSNIFGPPVGPSVDRWTLAVNNFCRQAVKDNCINLETTGKQRRDFLSVYNALAALDIIINKSNKTGELFNVGSGKTMRIIDMANSVADAYASVYGRTIPIITGDKDEPENNFDFSIEKIRKLGYKPQDDNYYTIKKIFEVCEKI